MKVLVVEDLISNLELFKLRLLKLGHDVVTASNGQEGVDQAFEHLPDLILMDMIMPGIDGYQATKIIKNDDSTKHIPIIAVSSNSSPQDISKALDAGCIKFIEKPLNSKKLKNILEFISQLN